MQCHSFLPLLPFLQATAILSYVADQASEGKLAPAHGTLERIKVLSLMTFIATEIHRL